MRLFIALKTDLNKKFVFSVKKPLMRRFSGVKWVETENIHLTLKFLGEVKQENIKQISDVLLEVSCSFAPFSFSYEGINGFPSKKNARVIFISVVNAENIVNLMIRLDDRLKGLGFNKEKTYIPHLTLGRVRGRGVNLETIKDLGFDKINVSAIGISLIKSTLTPQGPIYDKISSFDFA